MIYFLGVISVLILFFISGIHIYWAFGGKWGVADVLPTKNKEQKLMNPPMIATLIVAVVMAVFAIMYTEKLGLISLAIFPDWLQEYGVYAIASIFMVRAIGEFKYVGFFKRVKDTRFAKNDTQYFSPLCLFLGVVGVLLSTF